MVFNLIMPATSVVYAKEKTEGVTVVVKDTNKPIEGAQVEYLLKTTDESETKSLKFNKATVKEMLWK